MLDLKIEKLNKVGETTAKRLVKIGIKTIFDLLYHFPNRYEEYKTINNISNLQTNEYVNLFGYIEQIQNKKSPYKKMSITEAFLNCENGKIKLIWFNQPFITKNLKPGDFVSISGKTENDYTGIIIKTPHYEKINPQSTPNQQKQGIIPIYPTTANITQKQIRFLIKQALNKISNIPDWLPEYIIKEYHLLSLKSAIQKIHFPEKNQDIIAAKNRLSFNELFFIQLRSNIIKNKNQKNKAISIKFKEKETRKFVNNLPFILTNAQKKSAWEILQDIEKNHPMTRLLEGDVGSGKTMVAILALLNNTLNKKQSVLMVPTEILAQQHFKSIKNIFQNYNFNIAIFSRCAKRINNAKKNISKNKLIEKIKSNKIDIVIGTHALIQENVNFANLSLAIIDEQHRFGVEQRMKITKKSGNKKTIPHLLSMTATPIPRSLALIICGDLDISIINQMPKGRKKIITKIVNNAARKKMYADIKKEINAGQQAFVVCPLIDESDKLGVKSVQEEYKKLTQDIYPDLQIELLHGKMKTKEKEKIMENFLKNKTKIIISTSVIEVGVDVPNATIMLIEGADRFGLAQLHQFRGRVGRGNHQSYCFLCSDNNSNKTKERLHALVSSQDGFILAKKDLKLRGPGEVYGTSQKGFPEFKIANLFDQILIQNTNQAVNNLLNTDPNLEKYPLLKEKIKNAQENVHFE